MVADAGLPTPDESWREPESIAFRWSTTGFVVRLDPHREDLAPLDELEAAMIKGLPPNEWPWPTADGYADYER
jgi:hypothetical protein